MDVSLVFITVLLEDGAKSHQTPEYALIKPKAENRVGYLQVSEVYVVPQAAVSNFKQSVLIGNESAQREEEDRKILVSHTEPLNVEFAEKSGALLLHFHFWTLGCQI